MTTITANAQQRMDALVTANEVRCGVANIRRHVSSLPRCEGCELVAGMLEEPDGYLLAMRVGVLLRSVRKIGTTRAHLWLSLAGVRSEDRRVRDLSPRQRRVLAVALRTEAKRPRRVALPTDRSCERCDV